MIDTRNFATLLAPAAVLLLASCVSKARYDEALAEVKFYQRNYQDLEAFQGKLESEISELRGMRDIYESAGEPLEAGVTAQIDQRMAELERMASGLGTAQGDVTVLQVEGGYGLRLSDSILFDSGSSEIRADGQELLVRMAGEITSRPYLRIWVRGHTDSDPVKKPETRARFPHGNLQLSASRAIEVAALLAQRGGIPKDRIVVAGFGANEPVVANDSALNKQKNRRVEIFVLEEEDEDTMN